MFNVAPYEIVPHVSAVRSLKIVISLVAGAEDSKRYRGVFVGYSPSRLQRLQHLLAACSADKGKSKREVMLCEAWRFRYAVITLI